MLTDGENKSQQNIGWFQEGSSQSSLILSKCPQALSETGAMCEDTCRPHEFQHVAPMHEVKEVLYQLAELPWGQRAEYCWASANPVEMLWFPSPGGQWMCMLATPVS